VTRAVLAVSWLTCAPQESDPGRTDAVAGPSASDGMSRAWTCWPVSRFQCQSRAC